METEKPYLDNDRNLPASWALLGPGPCLQITRWRRGTETALRPRCRVPLVMGGECSRHHSLCFSSCKWMWAHIPPRLLPGEYKGSRGVRLLSSHCQRACKESPFGTGCGGLPWCCSRPNTSILGKCTAGTNHVPGGRGGCPGVVAGTDPSPGFYPPCPVGCITSIPSETELYGASPGIPACVQDLGSPAPPAAVPAQARGWALGFGKEGPTATSQQTFWGLGYTLSFIPGPPARG